MQRDAILKQLGYIPNNALLEQLEKIEKNTIDYGKIQKHIIDLHSHLKIDDSFVALSNSKDYFKIKIEASSKELSEKAHEKILHFSNKFKINIERVGSKDTYYILGFKNI